MPRVAYRVALGGLTLDSAADPRTELLEVRVRRAIGALADRCRIVLHAPPPPQPGLLEQAVGAAMEAVGLAGGVPGAGAAPAFDVPVRGEPIKPDDTIVVELTSGGTSAKVLTARVEAVRSDFGRTTIVGRTAVQTLAQRRINQVYMNQSFGAIVRDLAQQAGVTAGTVEDGETYPYVVVHEARTVLDQLLDLARREGVDVFADADGRLVARAFDKQSPDHVLHYGIHLLGAEVLRAAPAADAVRVEGESPASERGAERWYWLTRDVAPFRAEIAGGERLRAVQDGALRTREAAERRAATLFGAAKDQATGARVRLLGLPTVGPGDAVEIRGAPKQELNGLFRVVTAEHRLSRREGYVTLLELSGQGGAAAAGGLLGGALGALAGAVGL